MQTDILPRSTRLTVPGELRRLAPCTLDDLARIGEESKIGMGNNFITYAATVKLRVDRGVDMRAEMPPILYMLAMGVAEGAMIPELLDLWLGNEALGEAVIKAEPPVFQQKKLLESKSVRIHRLPETPTEEVEVKEVPVNKLTREDVEILIDKSSGEVRDSEESQLKYQVTKRNTERRAMVKQIRESGTFTCDRKRKVVKYKCKLGIVEIPFRDIEIMNEYREGKI